MSERVNLPRVIALACWMLASLWSAPGSAHESRPAYLELIEQRPGQFDVLWRRPARGDLVLAVSPVFPPGCREMTPKARYAVDGSVVERWRVDCGPEGLAGREVVIEGLALTNTEVLARVTLAGGISYTRILRPQSARLVIDKMPESWDVTRDYFVMGMEHILGGVDHLLFVFALLLIVRGVGLLVKTITAFTVAHSITLGMATLGVVHVPSPPVEAVIALSIVFVACEIARKREGHTGLTERYPWLVALSFGLLHGFGFAGALAEVGLPQTEIPLALLMFNVGVEAGQLTFVAVALALGWGANRYIQWPHWTIKVTAYVIGSVAAFWVVDRVVGFW